MTSLTPHSNCATTASSALLSPRSQSLVDESLYLHDQFDPVPGRRPIDGAFGTVQICTRRSDRRCQVAVKHLRYTTEDAELNNRMDRILVKEIVPLQLCDHRNVLKILGLTRDSFLRPGIVMAFAEHGSLQAYLPKNPAADRPKILKDIASGLAYLHSLTTAEGRIGLAHGDLHPGNVLLQSDPKGSGVIAVLSDFGLCKLLDAGGMTSVSARHSGAIEGVAAYLGPEVHILDELQPGLRPEVVQGAKYAGLRTIKNDVFAFGMLMFTTFGGDFRPALCNGLEKTISHMISIAIVQGFRPRRSHAPLLPEHYWKQIQNCWQGDAAKRPTITDVKLDP